MIVLRSGTEFSERFRVPYERQF